MFVAAAVASAVAVAVATASPLGAAAAPLLASLGTLERFHSLLAPLGVFARSWRGTKLTCSGRRGGSAKSLVFL